MIIIPAIIFCFSCTQETKNKEITPSVVKANFEYGYDLNEFTVLRDTIRSGDTFGAILDENHVTQGEIYSVVLKIKDSFIQSFPSFGFAVLNLFIAIKTFSTYF